jgi:hypothetical protein
MEIGRKLQVTLILHSRYRIIVMITSVAWMDGFEI